MSNEFKSINYWDKRYAEGGDSGKGSYGQFAQEKADIVNQFVQENKIKTVVDFGCGDGNQLEYAQYENYLGLDVSEHSIKMCQNKFKVEKNKSFLLYEPLAQNNISQFISANMTLSLEVMFHIVEDEIFNIYLNDLFTSSNKYVVILNYDREAEKDEFAQHCKLRKFSGIVADKFPEFKLIKKIENPLYGPSGDLFFYKK